MKSGKARRAVNGTPVTGALRESGKHFVRLLVAGFVTAAAIAPAAGHEFWLVPHGAEAKSGDVIVFELRVGPIWPGVQTAKLPKLFNSFVMQDSQGGEPVEGRDGALAVGHVRVREPGAAVIALRTNPARLELPGGEFDEYLKEEGLAEVIDFRQINGLQKLPGRELFSRCAKTVVLVDGVSKGFNRTMNLPLEITPVGDPLLFKPGTKYTVRLTLNGKPLEGALIKAQLKADQPVELTARSDGNGSVSFALPTGGLWLFNAVHMESSMEASADWESLWASMTVVLPEH